jgi:alanyl-tRNA synthetase
MALFGEKYGDFVRTIQAGSDSFELCGGNHVSHTGELGSFVILSETGVAAGVRRIEAVVAHSAHALIRHERGLLKQVCYSLKTDQARLLNRVDSLQDEVKQLKKALDKARKGGGGVNQDDLFSKAVDVAGVPFVVAKVEVDDRGALNALLDHLREKKPEGMYLLCGVEESGKVMLSAGAGHTLKANRRFHAGKLIGAVAPLVGGRGGGRPDFANGGGTDATQIDVLIAQAPTLLAHLVG